MIPGWKFLESRCACAVKSMASGEQPHEGCEPYKAVAFLALFNRNETTDKQPPQEFYCYECALQRFEAILNADDVAQRDALLAQVIESIFGADAGEQN